MSLALLADEEPGWEPKSYEHSLHGTRVDFGYRTVKIWEYNGRWAELEKDPNPFALVVMAHLKTKATRGNARRAATRSAASRTVTGGALFRREQRLTCQPPLCETPLHLSDPFGHVSLRCCRPAPEESRNAGPMPEPLLHRQRFEGIGLSAHARRIPREP